MANYRTGTEVLRDILVAHALPYTVRDILAMPLRQALALPGVGRKVLARARQEAEPVIVTRHHALVDYLLETGLVPDPCQVIEHATEADVAGRHVYGVLPLRLAARAALVTEVPLDIPRELRGQELTLKQVRQYAGEPRTYFVDEEV